MPVLGGPSDFRRADRATRATTIFDNDILAEL
jgi:hypothetical protein